MSTAPGGRELFVYWRLRSAQDLEPALDAVRRAQAALCQQHDGLSARLFERADSGGLTTVMEVYARADGVSHDLQATIESSMSRATAPFLDGQRHVEWFRAR